MNPELTGFFSRISMTPDSYILSNARLKSIKHRKAGLLNSFDFSMICFKIKISSIVDLFHLKPCCSSRIPMSLVIILVKSFWTELSRDRFLGNF